MSRTSGFLAVGLAVIVLAGTANGQGTKNVAIRGISWKKSQTPLYKVTVTGGQNATRRNWIEITTEFATRPDWMDELRFRYYVLVKGKKGQKLFSDDVSYVNIEKGKHLSVMYLHPSTRGRYGDIQAVGVQIYYRDQLVALASQPKSNKRWWEEFTPVRGLVLNRLETPFAMINFDNYEAIKAAPNAR